MPDLKLLTIGDLLQHFAPEIAARPDVPAWPPDAFALIAAILQRSGAYTAVVHDWPPAENAGWNEWIESVGLRWRRNAAHNGPPPPEVIAWWNEVRAADHVAVDQLRSRKEITFAMLQILAAADEASAGIGVVSSGEKDRFDSLALPLLLENDSRTLCKDVAPSRLIVLPKAHTPQNGITIRSLTHHLALYIPGEVSPMWWMQGSNIDEDAWCLNILILPWPRVVRPMHFRAAAGGLRNMDPHFGFFDCDVRSPEPQYGVSDVVDAWKLAHEHLAAVEGESGATINLIVFPELALREKEPLEIMQKTNALVIGGVGVPSRVPGASRNYACVAIPPTTVEQKQDKHHRWKLDGKQIQNYGIGSRLDPTMNWWENIAIDRRELKFFAVNDWFTFSVLICEDLARLDPVTELLRAVAPNLVVALLLDGPQLSSRWPARYATVLADDPGTSVLTVTSLGMATSSVPAGHQPSRVIALWKDARSAVPEEIPLDPDAIGVVLNVRREFVEEWSADGRGDHATTGYLLRNKVHQIRQRPAPAPKPPEGPRKKTPRRAVSIRARKSRT
jgi:hypothetical protein